MVSQSAPHASQVGKKPLPSACAHSALPLPAVPLPPEPPLADPERPPFEEPARPPLEEPARPPFDEPVSPPRDDEGSPPSEVSAPAAPFDMLFSPAAPALFVPEAPPPVLS